MPAAALSGGVDFQLLTAYHASYYGCTSCSEFATHYLSPPLLPPRPVLPGDAGWQDVLCLDLCWALLDL